MAGEYRWHLLNENRESLRQQIVEFLGGVCVTCGTTEELEFHHKYGNTWQSNKLGSYQRLLKYKEEAEAGLLELLCDEHHTGPNWKHPDECFCPMCRERSEPDF